MARGRSKKKSKSSEGPPAPLDRSPPWDVIYYKTKPGASGKIPAIEFLGNCPASIDAQFQAVLDAVASAPPPSFSGGGKWEAMHGDMGGYYEIRIDGPGREHFRLFCQLENGTDEELRERGLKKPAVAVLTGMRKPFKTTFSDRDYASVRRIGDSHRSRRPRCIA